MGTRRWILWQGLIAPSMERVVVGAGNGGFEFSGLIVQAHEDTPYVARYRLQVDDGWRTHEVEVELENGGRRSLALSTDAVGHWRRDGQPLSELDDCLDIDLEWSPSTNTLPIRRLGLGLGQTRSVTAAWIRFRSLQVQRLEQSYERIGDDRYRYRSGRFTADLAVDEDGLVLQYGVNWKAIAMSGELISGTSTAVRPA
jgi:hypothetical protein